MMHRRFSIIFSSFYEDRADRSCFRLQDENFLTKCDYEKALTAAWCWFVKLVSRGEGAGKIVCEKSRVNARSRRKTKKQKLSNRRAKMHIVWFMRVSLTGKWYTVLFALSSSSSNKNVRCQDESCHFLLLLALVIITVVVNTERIRTRARLEQVQFAQEPRLRFSQAFGDFGDVERERGTKVLLRTARSRWQSCFLFPPQNKQKWGEETKKRQKSPYATTVLSLHFSLSWMYKASDPLLSPLPALKRRLLTRCECRRQEKKFRNHASATIKKRGQASYASGHNVIKKTRAQQCQIRSRSHEYVGRKGLAGIFSARLDLSSGPSARARNWEMSPISGVDGKSTVAPVAFYFPERNFHSFSF